MRYLPHTQEEIESMLRAIGVPSIDALFEPIPEASRLGRPLALEPSLDESSLMGHMEALSARNGAATTLNFLGGGIYDHHVPPVVDQLLLRGEFFTAYTPYQAEVAQGTLQAIFEFQTLVCELFGMPVANASMYDGASATAEAVLMARRLTKRTRVLVSQGIHPEYQETVRTYLQGLPGGTAEIEVIPCTAAGSVDIDALAKALDDKVACVVLGYPNFFGCMDDVRKASALAHDKGALVVTATAEPYALALVEPPGVLGADIAVGEGQALGLGPQYGGPGCGLFACKDTRDFMQNIPGRLCGETVDKNGHRGYVLTLATREQHIRRDRATSNICTNHALCALAITIRACLLGKTGFVDVAKQCLAKAEYARQQITKSGRWTAVYSGPTFNEFVVRSKSEKADVARKRAQKLGILAGIDLARFDGARDQELLVCVTERHSREDIDRLAAALNS